MIATSRFYIVGVITFTVAFFALLAIVPSTSFARSSAGDPVVTRSLAGGYLAGRFARSQHDTKNAVRFYRAALSRDPDNDVLIEQSFLMEASEGNWGRAAVLARRLVAKKPRHRMAHLFLGLSAFTKRKFAKADKHFKAAESGPIGELTGTIARAWVNVAAGNVRKAIKLLRKRRQAEWAQYYLSYHRALIADLGELNTQARRDYKKVFEQDSRTLRTALAYARHAANQDDTQLAKNILAKHKEASDANGAHPLVTELLEDIRSGDEIELLLTTPREGLAEVFYGLGEALTGEGGVSIGIMYLQMALYLKPQHPFALAALANAYETVKRYEDAIDAYDRIERNTPLRGAINIRKALNLNSLDRVDDARDLLEKVAKRNPLDIKPLDALGNIMRARKRYREAIVYYTRLIDLIQVPKKRHWAYYYSRGTCYERIKDWPPAERDLKKALKLNPKQPLALNYLGYSWIDQNRNLREGMTLIEQAVSLKPEDGYIVDSLGWAHYKLGNFAKAVKYLERAVELRPDDPVLNDHLGDALWRVGRVREAKFQWDQAVSLGPEKDELDKIKKKLAEGLPPGRQASIEPAVTPKSPARGPSRLSDDPAPPVPLPARRNNN